MSAVNAPDGAYVVATGIDVTEREEVASRMRDNEAYLRTIVAAAIEAIVTIDERGIIETFSLAAVRLLGYEANEAIGHNVRMLMPSPDREAHDGYIARYLETGKRRIIGIGREVTARRKDGALVPVNLSINEMVVAGSRKFLATLVDLTRRKKMEQHLAQAQKMEAIGQLTGGVAHDFNNLLTGVLGNLEMLEEMVPAGEAHKLIEEAREAGDLGAHLTGQLLSFSRRGPLTPKTVSLNDGVLNMTDLLRPTLGERILLRTVLASALPSIRADPGQLETAIINLAVNARDAMPHGGPLTIETSGRELSAAESLELGIAEDGWVVLSIGDRGEGMFDAVLRRSFEPFFTTKKGRTGTGLGLSMVYGFVTQSGGHVRVASQLGAGTTMTLYFLAVPGPPEWERERRSVALPAGAGQTILLVQDEDRVRRVAGRLLTGLGYAVTEAADGEKALRLLRTDQAFDLLFTDVVMPRGLDGATLAWRARELRPGLAILFATGYAGPDPEATLALRTTDRVLAKPYTQEVLARAVAAALARA
ncbi:MAG: PAS domain S-box protein [Alphaproteobacteria bacterium]|nr:PAS domain S-box protein [Alphaproteobacteria bacterium]